MSEYQYYEFRALDRPLTQAQMGELRAYSSRAQITSTGFVNVYKTTSALRPPCETIAPSFAIPNAGHVSPVVFFTANSVVMRCPAQ